MAILGRYKAKNDTSIVQSIDQDELKKIIQNRLWLSDLNEDQLLAVETPGNLAIIASAGSGKTKTIIARIANLIHSEKVPANRIIATTFTRKAAGEMKDRLRKWGCPEMPFMGTFHSVMSIMMRKYPDLAGPYKKGFSVAKDTALRRIVSRNLIGSLSESQKEEFESIVKDNRGYMQLEASCNAFLEMVSALKGNIIFPEKYEGNNSFPDWYIPDTTKPAVRAAIYLLSQGLYRKYEHIKMSMQVMDIDDLIYIPTITMMLNRNIRSYISGKFDHVIVDENQDCSALQVQLSHFLSGGKNLACVGDDGQSIYSWRGGDVTLTREWASKENVSLIRLVKNYRSSEKIVRFANEIIRQDPTSISKEMIAAGHNKNYALVPKYTAYDHEALEVDAIVSGIDSLIKDGISPNQIAVISRNRLFAEEVYKALLKNTISARYDRDSFFNRRIVRFYIALIRLTIFSANHKAAAIHIEDLFKLPEFPVGIGEKMGNIIIDNIAREDEAIPEEDRLIHGLKASIEEIRVEKVRVFLQKIIDTVNGVGAEIDTNKKEYEEHKDKKEYARKSSMSFFNIGESIGLTSYIDERYSFLNSYYEDIQEIYKEFKSTRIISDENILLLKEKYLKKNATKWTDITFRQEIEEIVKQIRNIEILRETIWEMGEMISSTGSLEDFLEMAALGRESKDEAKEAIEVMTIHGAKGLEWDFVFWGGLNDSSFFKDENAPDVTFYESVRLCYVAATRAKKELHMSWSLAPTANYGGYLKFPNRLFLDIDPTAFINDDPTSELKTFRDNFGDCLQNLRYTG